MARTILPITYCTVDDMLTTLPEIGSVSTVTSAILAHYAGRAEAEINGRISARYVVPVSPVPPILNAIAIDLSIYYTLGRKPLVGSQSKSDPWLEKFKESRDLLMDIANGVVPLVDDAGTVIEASTTQGPFWSNKESYNPTFYEGEPEDWGTDATKVEDEQNKRS